jgi:NAD(P)H-hydrate repair Nnr-like enzyme with NAD(P)H-hydrate dehydratase domain
MASAWGVWLHGEAGRLLAERSGRIGFLARELIPLIPRLMHGIGPGIER